MASFVEVLPESLQDNPFRLIGKEWALITAERDGAPNTMTASWGGLGVLWGKNVAFIFIRPQRYTKEFVDGSDGFSLTFFPEEYRKKLSYLGTVSGRDEDKIKTAGLTVLHRDGIPYFEESRLAVFCKKLYAQPMRPDCFTAPEQDAQWYPEKDYHTLYVGEITAVLQR